MSDLVERLRNRANDKRPMPKPFNLLLDAADRIEQLERRANDLEIARQNVGDQLGIEIDRLQRELAESRELRAILEGHLSAAIDDYNEARRQAFIEAAEIAENHDTGGYGRWDNMALCQEVSNDIAVALRARAEETKG